MGDPSAPTLVCCNGVGVSTFFWKYIAQHYKGRFNVVLWDYRGHGLSSMPVDVARADLTIERNAKDLEAVLQNVGGGAHQPVILLGHSMGCQVILEYAKQFPTRVRAIIPMFGTFGKPLDTMLNTKYFRPVFGVIQKVAAAGGKAGMRMMRPLYASPFAFTIGTRTGLVDRYYAGRADVQNYLDHLNHMDPRVFLRMVAQMADHDMESFLPQITAPTLVIAAEKDLFTPLHRSQTMARLIPHSELIILPEGSHAAIVEHPETINLRIDRFLEQRVFPAVKQASAG